MRRFWAWTGAATALLLLAMAATLLTPIGLELWHYNVSFAAALLVAALGWPLLRRRRVATLAMLWNGVAATVTGFVMLYTKDLAAKEWWTFWHSFTSFALLLAFLVHWLHNNARLWDFTKRLFARERRSGVAAIAAWSIVGAAAAWTWLTPARELLTSENYVHLASWTVLAGIALTYGVWLVHRLPAMRARLAETRRRNRARALVDTSLFLAHWGALVTGLALLYFADPLRSGPLKYVSKWWHTSTSVAFVALVALHVGFNARLVAAHARRVDDDLAPKP